MAKKCVESESRWEFCPHCGSGWSTCLGLNKAKTHWQYSCTHTDCEAYFIVEVGTGEMDKRIGMQLSESVLYWLKCDKCRKENACQVIGLTILCTACHAMQQEARYTLTVTYIGYVECEKCKTITYINKPKQIKIWAHPDDEFPLAQVQCSKCKEKVEKRLTWDHVSNFRKRGCKILSLNEKFDKITEEEIDAFKTNFDAEYARFFDTAK